MEMPRRPSMADRTMSTPLCVKSFPTSPQAIQAPPLPSRLTLSILTPPPSPRHTRSSSDLSNMTDDPLPGDLSNHGRLTESKFHTPVTENRIEDGVLICPYNVEILKDQRGQKQIFGHGAWSTVFRGTCHEKAGSGMMTPPLSPTRRPPLLVAIKQPARKDAKAILESEARILSYLMEKPDNDRYIVPFHGILQTNSSIVLTAIPLSLEEQIKKSAISSQVTRTTWNMSEPVIGNTNVWLNLAYKLVSALLWLHEQAMVVHGDIKPGNILLDRQLFSDHMDIVGGQHFFPYKPIFADFSSSQRLGHDCTPNTLSAVTREYTAPELLTSRVLANPDSTATKASDIFSLAVTLLVAATGNTMVYSGSVYQRQAMATQGWMVIQAVRNGPMEEGARVPRKGLVEKVLENAVLRNQAERTDAIQWRAKVEGMVRAESSKL